MYSALIGAPECGAAHRVSVSESSSTSSGRSSPAASAPHWRAPAADAATSSMGGIPPG